MWGFVSPILPQLVGNYNFQECKSPPEPVPGVVGHYIDRCIIGVCSIMSKSPNEFSIETRKKTTPTKIIKIPENVLAPLEEQ